MVNKTNMSVEIEIYARIVKKENIYRHYDVYWALIMFFCCCCFYHTCGNGMKYENWESMVDGDMIEFAIECTNPNWEIKPVQISAWNDTVIINIFLLQYKGWNKSFIKYCIKCRSFQVCEIIIKMKEKNPGFPFFIFIVY